MAALDGAVALAEVADGAVVVGEDLDLDVAGAEHLALEVEVVAAEGAAGEGAGALDGAGELGGAGDDGHADAAAAAAGLDDQRVADLGRGAFEVVVGEVALGAGDEREAPLAHRGAGLVLVAHQVDVVAAGPDEGDAALLAGAGEVGVLGEQAVARVDGVAAGGFGGVEDGVDVEVRLRDGGGTEPGGAVGAAHVQGAGVGVGVDGVRADAEAAAGAHDADGDLAAVGDQESVEGGGHGAVTAIRG